MILLSFDTEEFDVPREHGVDFPLDEAMKVSVYGTNRILDCLKNNGVKATFFCTSNFAENAPEVMRRIMDEGHEVAAHGCDHWQPQASDVSRSKEILERLTGRTIQGYRQPRMFPVSDTELERMGYVYNSSLNPAFIPGRYMHLSEPRTCFMTGKLLQIPALLIQSHGKLLPAQSDGIAGDKDELPTIFLEDAGGAALAPAVKGM